MLLTSNDITILCDVNFMTFLQKVDLIVWGLEIIKIHKDHRYVCVYTTISKN